MKKSNNKNLNKANKAKNDDFYTQLTDIEKELGCYPKNYFKNKVIFCNCDDPKESNFWKYFELRFDSLGLKKLVSTHFEEKKPSYKLEIVRDKNGKMQKPVKTKLKQNGDFRSPECIEILKEADIVITNPPFSLFREYVAQLIEYKKKFIIIGSENVISYQKIFKLIKDNKIWLGYTSPKEFMQPNGSIKKFGNISWFTNIKVKKRNEDLTLYKKYRGHKKEYPKYDNYNAINNNKVTEIPVDYNGEMGVPISFLHRHNPKQFELLGQMATTKITNLNYGYPYVNGNKKYARIIIKKLKGGKK